MPRLPLRGADLVLMAMHSRWAAAGASNNAMMVVECDGPVPPARLRHTVDRLLDVCPWSASRLRRPFPWGALHWAAGRRAALAPPPIRTVAAATSADVHRELETDLNAAIDPRVEAPLRFLLVDAGAGSRGYLVLTWFHPLMDPRGSRGLLTYLVHLDGSEAGPRGTTHPTWSGPPDPRSLRVRGALGA